MTELRVTMSTGANTVLEEPVIEWFESSLRGDRYGRWAPPSVT